MATNTTKLALSKPDGTDLVDIAVLNGNFDKIDAASGATICTSTTRPASPWNGQVIFETDTLNALVYRTATSSWAILGGSTVASDPPAGAGNGNFWWDSDNGKLYIYYNDGNSSQWVSVMPATTQVDVSQNYIINGGFDIWQRGTSTTSNNAFLADRWGCYYDGTGTFTYSQQTFTPGAAPVAGYEGTYFARYASASSGTSTFAQLNTRLEDVRTLAGQTVTLSFFAKADSARTFTTYVEQYFGAGGSSTILANQTSHSVTTGWQRFTTTFTMPSISGKTITTGTYIQVTLRSTVSSSFNMDIWGVQLEKGSVATSFRRNQPNIQAELTACQRYCYVASPAEFTSGIGYANTAIYFSIAFPVEMRTTPSYSGNNGSITVSDNFASNITTTTASTGGDIQVDNRGSRFGVIGFPTNVTVTRPYMGLPITSYGSTYRLTFSAEL